MLSSKWSSEDVIYKNENNGLSFNNGVMCMFEDYHDGKVNKCIIDYALNNNRKDTLLYNNRLYFSISKPKTHHKEQCETNRQWILNYFK